MADQPATERTEYPTPRKLGKARGKGHVPQSQELTSVVTLLVLIAMLALLGPNLLQWIELEIKQGMSCEHEVFANTKTFIGFVNAKLTDSILVIIPILIALVASAVLASISVSGLNFSTGAIELRLSQLNPVTGITKLFNARSVVRLLTSILKLFFVTLIICLYLRSQLETLAALRWAWSGQIMATIARVILGLLIRIGIALLIIGIADAIYQKRKYIDDLKMTRQEVRQDHKDTEGSPELKRRIRTVQFQMALKRTLQEVPKATVVLVNPTHYAVALRYDSKKMNAPIMVAKGADHLAEKIREIARAYGVPIISKPELARTIYSTVEPGNPIPEHLYAAVAQVLALIYRLRNKNK